jgi:hypothetical protein
MTITQTVEIPADRRLIIEVPRELPTGRTILTFTPAPKETKSSEYTEAELREIEYINRHAERLNREAMEVLSDQWPGFSEEKLREMERVNRQAAELNRGSEG